MVSVAFLLGMVLCMLLGVPYIDFLKKKMIGQYVKDLAPQNHAKKQGTPTTGGVFIISAVVLASIVTLLLAQKLTAVALITLITLVFYAFAGVQDDYIKIKGKGNDGLTPRGKLFRQIAIALLPTLYLIITDPNACIFSIGNFNIDLKYFYPFFAVFIITGSSNAYNLTDGLDGLAAGCGIFSFIACSLISLAMGETELAIISASVAGGLLGFLKFNKPKAEVFMGDTGSLAIGGLLGTIAVLGKFEFLLIFIGGVFVMETLSVILQVTSFKTTGKRIFKMSPIHHHFELCGHSEIRIVKEFAFVSLILSVIAVILYLYI
jgi:phospho-N-acetylmuramoyl-pentapeptide-transferase